MVHPAVISVLALGHEALGGTAVHVLEAVPGPHTGKVVAPLHTAGGLAAHHAGGLSAHYASGQGHQAIVVVGVPLQGVFGE